MTARVSGFQGARLAGYGIVMLTFPGVPAAGSGSLAGACGRPAGCA
jgi:hypothetical protein